MQDNAIHTMAADDIAPDAATGGAAAAVAAVATAPEAAVDGRAVLTAYLATWNATDAGELRALLATHWSPEATYTDPLAEVAGHDGVAALVGGVQAQFPGFVFTAVGQPDAHHRQVRFRWGLGPQGADPVVIGSDVVVLDAAGRIADVRGFLDVVPEGVA